MLFVRKEGREVHDRDGARFDDEGLLMGCLFGEESGGVVSDFISEWNSDASISLFLHTTR